jgi:hypothetical protein
VTFTVRPISLKAWKAYVDEFHRHNDPHTGHKFSVGLYENGELIGIGVAGRPSARMLDDGMQLEITRTCTNGTKNANSAIYGALTRAARALGYTKLITYTQAEESGASLRAVGWRVAAELPPRSGWSCKSRPRKKKRSDGKPRTRWELTMNTKDGDA